MKKYNQLSLEQRYQIQALLSVGKTYTMIAEVIGVNKSTISRELRRNVPLRGCGAKEYNAEKAWHKTKNRHAQKPKHCPFTVEMKMQIVKWMKTERLTPELISAKAKLEGIDLVSHESIYRWIWAMKRSNRREDREYKYLYRYLKHGKRRQKRGRTRDARGIIPNRISIEKRPDIVNKRKRVGDYEVDLMMGKGHKSAVLVITDRATIKTRMRKVNGKNSLDIAQKIVQSIKSIGLPVKTLTFDNDMAFSMHKYVADELKAKTYFTHPYTSQEKGTVENRIGVIRMFYPKKTDFNLVSSIDLEYVEKCINNRPVRKFNYRTPNQMVNKLLNKCCSY